ncbi:ras GEF [Cutaneotrichosporon oleaginosum]|uniref:Ras GEF n=1 Tax=Cutaneotrichosporon oleaginosum TaxID=879819 RepID=A0A0J0XDC9_9TREE|nr:ras GEF [Cutaneotrichosporon oleaginosum]KLT39067.1 ras GEF [Cutaneotrichosporon oleaginosum]TXT11850.1 hypothetical protein COLE_02260 [Cutaneotrichosporon oleaginosum]
MRRASAASAAASGPDDSSTGHVSRLSNQSVSGYRRSRRTSSTAPNTPPSPSRSSGHHHRQSSMVVALVDFDGSMMGGAQASTSSDALVYLSFRGGQYIRVITRDPSGWWDGECDSRRGWFPSNYVKPFDWGQSSRRESRGEPPSSPRGVGHDTTRNVASSFTEARSRHASMLSSASYASYQSHTSQQSYSTVNHTTSPLSDEYNALLQPAIAALTAYQRDIRDQPNQSSVAHYAQAVLASIRTILSRTGCVKKHSDLLRNSALSRARSATLNGLTPFVNSAKRLQVSQQPYPEELVEATLAEVTSLFRSIRRFVAVASELGVPVGDEEDSCSEAGLHTAFTSSRRMRVTVNGHSGDRGSTFRLKSASTNDLRYAARRQGTNSPPPPMPVSTSSRPSPAFSTAMMSPASSGQSSPGLGGFGGSLRGRPRTSSAARIARSTSFELLLSGGSSPDFVTPDLSQSTSAVPTRREEEAEHAVYAYTSGQEVHEAVAAAEDGLLSVIASFIGHIHSHHIDSHPSSHAYLIELTRETVDTVRELLSIIEGVGRGAGPLGIRQREIEGLKVARDELFDAASNLVESAEKVANAPFTEASSDQYDDEKSHLLQHTTLTLRAGSECARVVRRTVPDSEDHSDTTTTAGYSSSTRGGYQGIGLGIRGGPQSIQGLQRRATSLTHLHKRFNGDGARVTTEGSVRRFEDEDDEEIVADLGTDDEYLVSTSKLPPRHSSRPISHPAGNELDCATEASRSRSTSMSSPSKRRTAFANEIDLTDDLPESSTVSRPPTLTSFSSQSHTSISQLSTTSPFPHSTSSGELQGAAFLPDQPINGDLPIVDPSIEGLKHAAKNFTPPAGPAPARPPPPPESPALSLDGKNEDGDLRFWVVSHDYDPREVAFNPDGVLVGGTLRVLIEKLTPVDGLPDRNFAESFWLTFRLFSTPADVLETFIQRFNIAAPPVVAGLGEEAQAKWAENKQKPVRYRVIICLKTWLDHHWRPATDDAVLDHFDAFLNSEVMQAVPLASRAQDSLRKRMAALNDKDGEAGDSKSSLGHTSGKSIDRSRASTTIVLSPNPAATVKTPIISKTLMAQLSKTPQPNINITDFDATELARQLTIMESKLFAAVAPEDLLQTGKKSVPELKALSTLSNQITGWVTDVILHELDTKHRGALLKFFIKLADKCLVLNNFSTLFAVLAGLNSSTIGRLKNTWAVLNPKYRLLMDRLRGVIEHTKNHAAYRARLREVTEPCLPFLGLILSDITFTQDGNPNTRPSTISPDIQLINQDKFVKLGRIAADFKRYQTPFDLKELDVVQRYLTRVLAERGSGSLDALYRKSLLLEPRQGSERLSSAVEKPGWLGARLQG